ncbi:hypothetical protein PG993_005609 [Apiospora rasikravindrae]|uniref:Uncharacterized protein n=1 Tax=Apiospora rasikravindrae TaxID=990691 RepID=A0ABR1TG26_9PEZI
MYDPKNAEAPLGDHCVCHYPDDTTHTWLIHDDDDQEEQQTAAELKRTTAEGSGGDIETTTAGSAEDKKDAIDIPLRYTAQGDPVKALYCACFVASETGAEDEFKSSLEGEPATAATDHLFAGAVVLNQTSGDYDFVQLQGELGGLTKAAAMFAPLQQHAEGEMRLPLPADNNNTTTTNGILGMARDQTAERGRYGTVLLRPLGGGAAAAVVALWDAATAIGKGGIHIAAFGVSVY